MWKNVLLEGRKLRQTLGLGWAEPGVIERQGVREKRGVLGEWETNRHRAKITTVGLQIFTLSVFYEVRQ